MGKQGGNKRRQTKYDNALQCPEWSPVVSIDLLYWRVRLRLALQPAPSPMDTGLWSLSFHGKVKWFAAAAAAFSPFAPKLELAFVSVEWKPTQSGFLVCFLNIPLGCSRGVVTARHIESIHIGYYVGCLCRHNTLHYSWLCIFRSNLARGRRTLDTPTPSQSQGGHSTTVGLCFITLTTAVISFLVCSIHHNFYSKKIINYSYGTSLFFAT